MSNFVFSFLNDCDICTIQEHWLFKEQLQSLNISDEYSSTAVSGMLVQNLLLDGPFVAVLYSIMSHPLTQLQSRFQKYLCNFTICSSMSILLICVYLPTNYGTSQNHDPYFEVLGELKGFIDAHVFDKVIVAGDFNVDFNHRGTTCVYLQALINDLQLCAVIDLLQCYIMHFT